jgi:anti-sigma factor RsiW
MNHHDAQKWIHAYADGELEAAQASAVEAHIQSCPICSVITENISAEKQAMTERGLSYPAPIGLADRIRRSLPRTESVPVPLFKIGQPWMSLAPMLAAIALVLGLTWAVIRMETEPTDRAGEEVVASHIRSLMANHLTDVASTDQHTVKPWFNGKLDFAPMVEDLSGDGFPLIGGRLDYIEHRPVAALVYQRRQHVINLFVWPNQGNGDWAPTAKIYRGYHVFHWSKATLDFWAVSDLNEKELGDLVRLLSGEKNR